MKAAERPFQHTRTDGVVLRGRYLPGAGALLVFLSGFRSVHTGQKATAVAALAAARGHGCLRFDYLGHGVSDGGFEGFRVSEAVTDAAACIRRVHRPGQRLVLVGSSMGGWIALELARRGAVAADGLLLIAPALDFVSRRLAAMPADMRADLVRDGRVRVPNAYTPDTSYPITRAFLDDALALEPGDRALTVPCPVRIVHGDADDNVPIATSRRLARRVAGATLVEIAGGDHRLSDHLPTLLAELERLLDVG